MNAFYEWMLFLLFFRSWCSNHHHTYTGGRTAKTTRSTAFARQTTEKSFITILRKDKQGGRTESGRTVRADGVSPRTAYPRAGLENTLWIQIICSTTHLWFSMSSGNSPFLNGRQQQIVLWLLLEAEPIPASKRPSTSRQEVRQIMQNRQASKKGRVAGDAHKKMVYGERDKRTSRGLLDRPRRLLNIFVGHLRRNLRHVEAAASSSYSGSAANHCRSKCNAQPSSPPPQSKRMSIEQSTTNV